MDRHEDRETDRERVSHVLSMDKAICTAANIQTEVVKGIPPGKGNISSFRRHIYVAGKNTDVHRSQSLPYDDDDDDDHHHRRGSSVRTLKAARAESLQ